MSIIQIITHSAGNLLLGGDNYIEVFTEKLQESIGDNFIISFLQNTTCNNYFTVDEVNFKTSQLHVLNIATGTRDTFNLDSKLKNLMDEIQNLQCSESSFLMSLTHPRTEQEELFFCKYQTKNDTCFGFQNFLLLGENDLFCCGFVDLTA